MEMYRAQFALTDSTEWFPRWNLIHTKRHFLHYQGLSITQAKNAERTLTLIGYAIDPQHPAWDDRAILNRLLAFEFAENLIEMASQLGGRWALFAEFQEREIIFHDACGLRQIFYSDNFCASQTTAPAEFYKLGIDAEAQSGFLETKFAKTNPEYWWPGDSTQYAGVKCLLPNHYLDLQTRKTARYALGKISNREPKEAAYDAASMLSNLVGGARLRFDLTLPLTAGWDSRAIFATCRATGIAPYCYTLRFGNRSDDHQDLLIPRKMLSMLGWKHHVIDCPATASDDFAAVYKGSVNPAHAEACAIAMGLQSGYPVGGVSLSGHCSEVARCFYLDTGQEITAEYLADITGMDATPFVLKQFNDWLTDARPTAKESGINLLDLFYWEQRAGRWAANGQAQWDIVHERFTAFNCRPLLLTLLSVDKKFRCAPDYKLYRRMIKTLSPGALTFPINPDSKKKSSGIKQRVKRALRSIIK